METELGISLADSSFYRVERMDLESVFNSAVTGEKQGKSVWQAEVALRLSESGKPRRTTQTVSLRFPAQGVRDTDGSAGTDGAGGGGVSGRASVQGAGACQVGPSPPSLSLETVSLSSPLLSLVLLVAALVSLLALIVKRHDAPTNYYLLATFVSPASHLWALS